MIKKGLKVVTGGTDNHIVLWDLRPQRLTGAKMEKLLDKVNITVNKNCVPGDKSARFPSGIRLGSPAMTSRGLDNPDFEKIAEYLDRGTAIAVTIQEESGTKLVDFVAAMENNDDLEKLGDDVKAWSRKFPMPGQVS